MWGIAAAVYVDRGKRHVKDAVGELTDDDGLEREGNIDEVAGRERNVAHKARDAVDHANDNLTGKH